MVDAADVATQLQRMSLQRWSLAFAGLLAATLAAVTTGIAGSGQSPLVLALVVGLAGAAIAQPDSHIAIGVPVVTLWYWTASTGASTNPSSLVVAVCLFAFHTVVALMAMTPPRATIDPRSGARWLRRCLVVVLATVGVWLLVVLVGRRQLPGSATVTATGLVVATTLMVAFIASRRSGPEDAR